MPIGELAQRTGVAPSAIRYYEELGLLSPAARVSGKRRYAESAVQLVGTILVLREAGFSLAEIKVFLTARRTGSSDPWRELASHKLVELEEHIASAQVARDAIKHALACRHDDVRQCPKFAGVLAAKLAGKSLAQAHVD